MHDTIYLWMYYVYVPVLGHARLPSLFIHASPFSCCTRPVFSLFRSLSRLSTLLANLISLVYAFLLSLSTSSQPLFFMHNRNHRSPYPYSSWLAFSLCTLSLIYLHSWRLCFILSNVSLFVFDLPWIWLHLLTLLAILIYFVYAPFFVFGFTSAHVFGGGAHARYLLDLYLSINVLRLWAYFLLFLVYFFSTLSLVPILPTYLHKLFLDLCACPYSTTLSIHSRPLTFVYSFICILLYLFVASTP